MKYIVQYSGGISSYCAAKRIVTKYGAENTTLLFCDTKVEDADNYRFLNESSKYLGVPLTTIADGRSIWEIFKDERFLGNSRIDPCSRVLKRELADKYVREHFHPNDAQCVIGYNWDEGHRFEKLVKNTQKFTPKYLTPFTWIAPMMEKPLLDKADMLANCLADGIKPPRLYDYPLAHANCGGGCVKAGQAHWKIVLEHLPDVYAHWEKNEQELRDFLGKDVSMMQSRIGGTKKPLTLKNFRLSLQAGEKCDEEDFGACSCFSNDEEEEA